MKNEYLTERQRRVFEYVRNFIQKNGVAPSQTEIASACFVRQGNVTKVLSALEKKSCIEYYRYEARGIELREENLCH
jgi:SOS-response transcriptional repressor LexA